jgi:hypothetical protein
LKEKQRHEAAGEAIRVAAFTLPYQMQAIANAHRRLPPATMAEAMLFIKQERIVAGDIPTPQVSSISFVSFQARPSILPPATLSAGMQVHSPSRFAASASSHPVAAVELDLNRTPDMDSNPTPLRKT